MSAKTKIVVFHMKELIYTGIFGLLLCLNDPLNYIIMFLISAGVAFALTWLFGYKDKELTETKKPEKAEVTEENDSNATVAGGTVYAPVEGIVIPHTEIKDALFAEGALGKGVGIIPEKGEVVAPFDGEITVLRYQTCHRTHERYRCGTADPCGC